MPHAGVTAICKGVGEQLLTHRAFYIGETNRTHSRGLHVATLAENLLAVGPANNRPVRWLMRHANYLQVDRTGGVSLRPETAKALRLAALGPSGTRPVRLACATPAPGPSDTRPWGTKANAQLATLSRCQTSSRQQGRTHSAEGWRLPPHTPRPQHPTLSIRPSSYP